MRGLADETEVANSSTQRYLKLFGVQPDRSKPFNLSNDPFFIEKGRGIVGLYLIPPDSAFVLCVDEKSLVRLLNARSRCCPWGWGMWKA